MLGFSTNLSLLVWRVVWDITRDMDVLLTLWHVKLLLLAAVTPSTCGCAAAPPRLRFSAGEVSHHNST
jgi:hypothetical protein